MQADREVSIVASVLLIILLVFYLSKPKTGQQRILDQLNKISFDDKFRGKAGGRRKGIPVNAKKKKRSMREKARVEVRDEKSDSEIEQIESAEIAKEEINEQREDQE